MSDNEIKVKLTADVKDFTDKMNEAGKAVDQFKVESIADIDAFINKLKDAENETDNFQKKYAGLANGSSSDQSSGIDLKDVLSSAADIATILSLFKGKGGSGKTTSTTIKTAPVDIPIPQGPAPAYGRDAAAKSTLDLGTFASFVGSTPSIGEAGMAAGGGGALEAGAATAGGMTATAFVTAVAAGITVGLAGVWVLVNTGALNAIADLGTAFQKAAPGLMNIFKVLFWPLGVIGTAAIDLVTGRIDKIPADIMNVVEQAKKASQELFGGISGIAMGFLNGIMNKINEIINSIKNIPSAASKAAGSIGGGVIGGITGFLGNIHLAEGGIVNGPTYSLIGEAGPEAVLPLSNLRSLLGSSGSQTVTIETPVYLDSDKIGEALTRRIRLREGI